MNIKLNGKEITTNEKTLYSLCESRGYIADENTVKIINGFQSTSDTEINEGDEIVFIKKGLFV